MAHPVSFLKGACLGAGAMYFFDPERGRRRRSLLRDQYVHLCHRVSRATEIVRKDASNRLYGTYAELRGAIGRDEPSDETLVARVRAAVGHHVRHASSIDVKAHGGTVTLFGTVPAHEVDDLLAAVHRVRGVRDVQSALRVRDDVGNVAQTEVGLSGRRGRTTRTAGDYLSPAARAVLGAAGLGLMVACVGRRTPSALLLGTLGFGLTTRSMSKLTIPRLFGMSRGRRGLEFQTGIAINAPIEQVFQLLTAPENYSRLSDVITLVEKLSDDRCHKMVRLPGGAEVMLAERIVALQPNEFIRWRSEPESFVPYAGAAWFNKLGDNRTEVQVCMSYNPPGGVLSHAAASIAHMNPRMMMDDLLMRAKRYLETGQQPRDAAEQRQPTVAGGQQQAEAESKKNLPRVEQASSPAQAGEPATYNL